MSLLDSIALVRPSATLNTVRRSHYHPFTPILQRQDIIQAYIDANLAHLPGHLTARDEITARLIVTEAKANREVLAKQLPAMQIDLDMRKALLESLNGDEKPSTTGCVELCISHHHHHHHYNRMRVWLRYNQR